MCEEEIVTLNYKWVDRCGSSRLVALGQFRTTAVSRKDRFSYVLNIRKSEIMNEYTHSHTMFRND